MNEGVKLLLERIKTHPEEFMKGGRWINILAEYNEYIPDELKPLTDEARKLVANEFTKDVMRELLDNKQEDWVNKVLSQRVDVRKTLYGRLKYDSIEESS
jgi:hypothetical protein